MDNEIKITADIVDYLGKYEDGVLVLLSIGYKEEYTEGTIYYSDKMKSNLCFLKMSNNKSP